MLDWKLEKEKLENLQANMENQQKELEGLKQVILPGQQDIDAIKKEVSALKKNVVFFATRKESTVLNKGDVLIFDKVETNIGKGYDHSSGVFKAPLTGVFQFTVNATGKNGHIVDLYLRHNQKRVFNIYTNGFVAANNSGVINLKVGDVVDVVCSDHGSNLVAFGDGNARSLSFSGILIKTTK